MLNALEVLESIRSIEGPSFGIGLVLNRIAQRANVEFAHSVAPKVVDQTIQELLSKPFSLLIGKNSHPADFAFGLIDEE
jgi:hypothetical protein